ncbi:MAG: 3-isopropylmalate dehydrogenase [Actinomycetota bacterium]|nr:3-isopropylmalate dehydrogenase [Actinomycetota bacterium]
MAAPPELEIAVLPGDGIGPEVVAEGVKVLRAVEEGGSAAFYFTELPWGTEWYLEHGEMMPADGLGRLAGFDAIYLGAIGSPLVPDHLTLRDLVLRIRFGFHQFVNLRPVRLLRGAVSPLAGSPKVDMVFVRENSEGEYAGVGDRLFAGTEREVALQTAVFSRQGVERVIRWAFEYARGTGRSRVASISKGNVLNYSAVLWDEVFDEVREDYPELESESLLVDAAGLYMVTQPERFDVVVASNLFADILSEIGAGIQGGVGLAASANLDPERRFPSMFEPIHGSAPDIAGRQLANPVGAIWSASLLLEHFGLPDQGAAVLEAVQDVLEEGRRVTPDLGGKATTAEMGDAVAARLRGSPHPPHVSA